MLISQDSLLLILPLSSSRLPQFLGPLNAAMLEFGITTPLRIAAFIAQVGHESGQFRYVKELASGAAYEGRSDLGNTEVGDGIRYKGRGLIQVTGRSNYTALLMSLDIDCLEHPEVLETPENACRSAAWWWSTHGLNELADTRDFFRITTVINGGTNGLAERQAFYLQALSVLH